nr:AAA family ATPase [Flaviflexus equikiangi]
MPGGRNHQLNKSAFAISQLIASGHIDAALAWDALSDTARRIGLTEHEIQATLKSAYRAGSTQPRQVDELRTPDTVVLQPVPAQPPTPTVDAPEGEEDVREPETIEEAVRQNLPILDWHDLWEQDEEEEWILEPLIAKRRGIVIYSPPKVGKSLFSLEMAVHISLGDSWLGTEIDAPHNVLYVDFENDPRGDTRARLQAMGYGPHDLQNLKMLSFPTLPGLDTKNGAQQLLAACQVYDCDIVIIDTISRAVDGDENENDTWLAFYRHTGLLLKQNEITMVRLDHTGKDESKGQRGGSAKSGDVDAIWKLSKVTEDGSKLQLKLDDSRMQITDRTLILDRMTEPRLFHKVAGAGQMAAWDAKVNEIIDVLDDHAAEHNIGRGKARDLLKVLGIGASNEVLTEAIRQRKTRPYAIPTLSIEEG